MPFTFATSSALRLLIKPRRVREEADEDIYNLFSHGISAMPA